MSEWVIIVGIVLAVATRPIESRLWLAGRISDRTLAILIVGRPAALCLVFGILGGSSWPFIALFTILGAVPGLLMYRFVRKTIRQAAEKGNPDRGTTPTDREA